MSPSIPECPLLTLSAITHVHPVYAGFDPTASSLHIGNLIPIIGLLHFQIAGHQPIALIGGATARVGDPSGRSTERQANCELKMNADANLISNQLSSIFKRANDYLCKRQIITSSLDLEVVNNRQWYDKLTMVEFLDLVGRHSRVSVMLTRDSVKSRMDSAEGISFAEFSYQLMQAYDFYKLNSIKNVGIQLGASDQWGNITAGLDLIKKINGNHDCVGVTLPLITNSTGEKFGKSAGNAIWLNQDMTSEFDFYQFFRKTPDNQVENFLSYFTFMDLKEIKQLMKLHEENPGKHLPQRKLASEVTELVHGEAKAESSRIISEFLFDDVNIPASNVIDAFGNDPRVVSIHMNEFLDKDFLQLAVLSGLCKSKSNALKIRESGGLYLNKQKISNKYILSKHDLIDGMICLLRSGKSNYRLIRII